MEEIYRIHGKDIIWSEKGNLWAIIILPDSIKIDNWHGSPHIHISDKKKRISINDPYKVFSKIVVHINRESGIILSKLLGEL